jgi:hypothetical protein
MMDQRRGRCRQQLLFGGLTLAFLFVAVSCRQSSGQDSPRTSAPPLAPTYVNTAYPRNHVPPNIYWGFVHVAFTAQTTYDRANTLLSQVGVYAYPMVNPPCGDLREAGAPIPVPTAMSPAELQADFQQSHSMLVQTDAWEKLNQVAASPGVVSVNPLQLPKSCPALAPI